VRKFDPIPFDVNLLQTVIIDTYAERPGRLSPQTTTVGHPAEVDAIRKAWSSPHRRA
jgi:hypothetical protein